MTTTAARTIGIMAARVNRADAVEVGGEFRTIDDYAMVDGRLIWYFTDGGMHRIVPTAYVTALA